MTSLSFEFHFGQDLAVSDVLDTLQTAITAIEPSFVETLRVVEYEGDPSPARVDASQDGSLHRAVLTKGIRRGETYEQLAGESSPTQDRPRRFGMVWVRGKARSTFLSVAFDERAPAHPAGNSWLWSNSIGGMIGSARIGRTPREEWVRRLASALGSHSVLVWGAAFSHDEFRFRNLHDDSAGTWAMGRDVRRSLPGLYWLNLFGEPYVQLIGEDRLSSADAISVQKVGSGMIVEAYAHPDDWDSSDGRESHARIVRQLGSLFFFDRDKPEAETTAPDFGLYPLPPRPPFQVMTGDAVHFTPLPEADTPF